MKLCKKICLFLASLMLLGSFAACGGSSAGTGNSDNNGGGAGGNTNVGDNGNGDVGGEDEEEELISVLTDKKYKRGFTVRGLGLPIYPEHAEEETVEGAHLYDPGYLFQYGKTDLDAPVWQLCQWATRYGFHDESVTTFSDLGNGKYSYTNPSKTFKVDTQTGEIYLGLDASECYVYGDRTAGQEWPHLLLSRDIKRNANSKVSDKSSINVSLDIALDKFEDKMTSPVNTGLHSAMCLFYVFVSNWDEASNNFSDMLWLGMGLFDNRYEYSPEMGMADEGSKDSATGKYIYNIAGDQYLSNGNNFYEDGEIKVDSEKYVSIDFDILPFIQIALSRAQQNGMMKSSKFENLYISGMYIGFELPGTYDIAMHFKNMDITVKY